MCGIGLETPFGKINMSVLVANNDTHLIFVQAKKLRITPNQLYTCA
jgi:hypothetical protein